MAFNVITDPWIPVFRPGGKVEDLSLRALLVEAWNIPEIIARHDLQTFGIIRTIVAFLTSAHQYSTVEELSALLERKRFDMAVIDAYIERVGLERFALFGCHPWMQNSALLTEKAKPVSTLMIGTPSGNTSIWADSRMEGEHAISPAEAARVLCMQPAWYQGTGRDSTGKGNEGLINGQPPIFVLVKGRNVFETLVLNLPVSTNGRLQRGGAWWEHEPWTSRHTRNSAGSVANGLTWMVPVLLDEGEGGICTETGAQCTTLVRTVRTVSGCTGKNVQDWTDPFAAYVPGRKEDGARRRLAALRYDSERDLWRDLTQLAMDVSRHDMHRPEIVKQFVQTMRACDDDRPLRLDVFGVEYYIGAVRSWKRWSTPPLPLALIESPEVGYYLREAIRQTEDVYRLLCHSLTAKDKTTSVELVPGAISQLFWYEVEQSYHELLNTISPDHPQTDVAEWVQAGPLEIGRRLLESQLMTLFQRRSSGLVPMHLAMNTWRKGAKRFVKS